MTVDREARAFADSLPVFEPAFTPYTRPKPLADARVAIVTTAGLRGDGRLHWQMGDESYHELPGDARDLGLAHLAPNFDRSGYLADPNVVFPVDRLHELVEAGAIGSVADRHFSFMGGQADHHLSTMRLDTGPAVAAMLGEDDVDVVVLTAVCPACTRAVCALANVFEAAGLATVSLVSVRSQAERARPPRALYGEFPLGRPLGRPLDPAFQHGVLRAAFALLEEPEGNVPVLATYPEVVHEAADEPLACALPPRYDPTVHPAVDEARGLLEAFRRSRNTAEGRTSFGKVLDVEGVGAALAAFAEVAEGSRWEDVGPVADPVAAATDIRSYYEEAAGALVTHTPAARQAEAWFFAHTEAAKVLLGAQRAMKAADHKAWFLLVPLNRQDHGS